ncbi:MAG: RHS repeat-associated core domain-containing protein, partial [Gemmatimonadales bacterium]
ALDRPDTVVFDFQRWEFERRLPHGVRVRFNSQGRHVATVNRLGHRTTFEYVGLTDTLRRITVPPAAAGKTYEFAYVNGVLSSVTAPPIGAAARITQLFASAGRVDSIRDPALTTVRFTYAGGARLTGRTDRLGTPLTFAFDGGGRLASATLDMGAQPALVTTVRSLETQGLTSSVDTARAYSWVDGPRTDVGDTAVFRLDRLGAPRRITNALGQWTLVTRGDPRWPALVTEVRATNGLITRATYDARGNLATSTVVNPLGDGRNSVTRYHWDPRWDFADSVSTHHGVTTTFAYDATTGNRLWQQVGPDSARRVRFTYGTTLGLLSSTRLPDTPPDSLEYDALGNLAATRTPKGYWTSFAKDGLGRDTLVVSPIESTDRARGGADGARLRVRTLYDLADQDTLSQTIGPPLAGAPEQTLRVRQTYDLEGNRLSLTREGLPDTTHIGAITTQWRYDPAGRRVVEVAPDGAVDSTVYDPAGNARKLVTRRGDTLTMAYDALNRLIERMVPAVSYPQRNEGIPTIRVLSALNTPYPRYPNDGASGYTIAADRHTFGYDAFGNQTVADNGDARVRRGYYPNGLIRAETLYVRTVAPLNAGGNFTSHRYVVAYRYDLDGRRIVLKYPSQLAAGAADSARYDYDPATGALARVWDLMGNGFRYHFNSRGEQDTLSLPNGLIVAQTYDDDGNLVRDAVPGARDAEFRSDARGKVLFTANPYGIRDTLTASYSGLGYLVGSRQVSHGRSVTGSTLRAISTDTLSHDALGNAQVTRSEVRIEFSGGFDRSARLRGWGYQRGTGRLVVGTDFTDQLDTLLYDAAGNTVFTWQSAYTPFVRLEDRVSYYAADGTVRAADYRTMINPMGANPQGTYTFEEYRYDALGRRVWVRNREDCDFNSMACRLSTVRRTVWEGSQELAEIQMPGGDATPTDTLENDTAPVRRAVGTAENNEDTNPFFGRVLYTYGFGIDQPLSITRIHYASQPFNGSWALWDPLTILPLWTVRGQPDSGVFAAGAPSCRTVDGKERCVKLAWPLAWNAQMRQTFVPGYWHGTLIDDKRDDAGTLYRRARAYDPATGRFTQEDPIGPAGGVNLYGFADGDPLNYSDPFGLCTICRFLRRLLLGEDDRAITREQGEEAAQAAEELAAEHQENKTKYQSPPEDENTDDCSHFCNTAYQNAGIDVSYHWT